MLACEYAHIFLGRGTKSDRELKSAVPFPRSANAQVCCLRRNEPRLPSPVSEAGGAEMNQNFPSCGGGARRRVSLMEELTFNEEMGTR